MHQPTLAVRGLPESGDYAIGVGRPVGCLHAARHGGSGSTTTAGVGRTANGVIEDAEAVDRWLIKESAAATDPDPSGARGVYLDSIISLVDSSNDQIGFADSLGDGGGEHLVAQLPAKGDDGEYVVEVSGFAGSIGIYEIELLAIEPADLAGGEEQPGSITEVGETQTYTFEGAAGKSCRRDLGAAAGCELRCDDLSRLTAW